MIGRAVALLVLAALVGGCVTTGTGSDFASLTQRIGPPKAGQARIVLFRETAAVGLLDPGWPVKLDDQPLHDVKNGTYVYADRPAGRHQLSAVWPAFPGETQREVTLGAGRTYFFMVKQSDRAKALMGMQAVGGLAGLVVGAAVTSDSTNPGPVEFVPLDEATARQAIAELRLAE